MTNNDRKKDRLTLSLIKSPHLLNLKFNNKVNLTEQITNERKPDTKTKFDNMFIKKFLRATVDDDQVRKLQN